MRIDLSEDVSAEFCDLMRADEPARDLTILAGRALALRCPRGGSVIDLGAGSGLATTALAEAMPDASIFAVEPSRPMRAVLHSRLAAEPGLRWRVTVVPQDVFGPDLPPVWDGAIAIHLVCQLTPADRDRLWRLFAQRLAANGCAVADRHFGIERAERVSERLSAETTLGEHVYQTWFSAEPLGPEAVRTRNRYVVTRDDAVIDESVSEAVVRVADRSRVMEGIEAAGLRVEVVDHDLLALYRAGR